MLDVSQGTRQPSGLYGGVDENDDGQLDDLRLDRAAGSFVNWQPFRDRAHDVSRTIRPGLLAGSVPGGAAFVGVAGRSRLPAIAAADERGRVAAHVARHRRDAGRACADAVARAQARRRRGAVRARGPRAADGRSRAGARRDELLLIAQLPDTNRPGVLLRPPLRLLRQAAFAVGAGFDGSPTSGTTRRKGLVSSIDIAPTALRWIGVEPPDRMRGVEIEDGPAVSAARLDELRLRWTQIRDGRQAQSFVAIVTLAGILFLLLGTLRDIRFAVRPDAAHRGARRAVVAVGRAAVGRRSRR